jgi:hypothetical protein
MIHVDVKKLGKVPQGGGWRLHGRDAVVLGMRVTFRALASNG